MKTKRHQVKLNRELKIYSSCQYHMSHEHKWAGRMSTIFWEGQNWLGTTDPSDSVFSGRDWLRNLQVPVQNKECGPTFRNEYGDIRALNQKRSPVWLHVLEQPGKLVPSLEEILQVKTYKPNRIYGGSTFWQFYLKLSHRKKYVPRHSNQKQNPNPTLLTGRLGGNYFPHAHFKLAVPPNGDEDPSNKQITFPQMTMTCQWRALRNADLESF